MYRANLRLVAIVFVGLLAESPAAFPQEELPATPHWIWTGENRDGNAVARLEHEFTVDESAHLARLKLAGDFCSVDIEIDNRMLLSVTDYAPFVSRELDVRLEPGSHTISLICNGTPGPSAVALRLELVSKSGAKFIATSTDWKDAISFGKVVPEYFGLGIKEAKINAFDDYEQWKDAKKSESSSDLPEFITRDGFEVQRIRKAEDDEGSWVSLAVDPQGRFIVAREDQGLLRLTPAADGDSIESVTTVNDTLKECRGLAFKDGVLFVNANNSKAMHVLRDTNGDDQFDAVEQLREFPGGVGHGRNDLTTTSNDEWVYSIHGDSVELPTDDIVDRTSPFRSARRGAKSSEGSLLRRSAENGRWELICAGLRNPFGVAIHPEHGELFTYDADAEFDMGAPWYRPTRVVQLVSGADYGWRGVTGKWPPYFPDRADNAVAVCDIGKGSPTAVKFGSKSNFPRKYRNALFILDWAYGRIMAVHLAAHGAGYRATAESFVRGRPLNVTDLDFGADGAMYVATGGRKTQSALYRIRYVGNASTDPQPAESSSRQIIAREKWSTASRSRRRKLESLHQRDDSAIEIAWPDLNYLDPVVRHAARVAIEHQPTETWRDRALSETRPLTALTALMALARSGDEELFPVILNRLNEFDLGDHSTTQQLAALRIYELCLANSQSIDDELRTSCRDRLSTLFPRPEHPTVTPIGWNSSVNHALSHLLTLLNEPTATPITVQLMLRTNNQRDRLHYLHIQRSAITGWTPEHRQIWFTSLNDATSYPGGRGFPGFLDTIRSDAIAQLTDAEKTSLGDLIQSNAVETDEPLPQRSFVKNWNTADLQAAAENINHGRDFANGQKMFRAALCSRCHRVGITGSSFGPDLTSVGRRFSVRDVLRSIVHPSEVIAEPYRSVQIVTKAGRVITGQIAASGDYRARELRIVMDPLKPSEFVTIAKKEIDEHIISDVSPMPKGLLNTLRENDVLDLLAYIVSSGDSTHPAFQ